MKSKDACGTDSEGIIGEEGCGREETGTTWEWEEGKVVANSDRVLSPTICCVHICAIVCLLSKICFQFVLSSWNLHPLANGVVVSICVLLCKRRRRTSVHQVLKIQSPKERREDARKKLEAVTDVSNVAGAEKRSCERTLDDAESVDGSWMEREW